MLNHPYVVSRVMNRPLPTKHKDEQASLSKLPIRTGGLSRVRSRNRPMAEIATSSYMALAT